MRSPRAVEQHKTGGARIPDADEAPVTRCHIIATPPSAAAASTCGLVVDDEQTHTRQGADCAQRVLVSPEALARARVVPTPPSKRAQSVQRVSAIGGGELAHELISLDFGHVVHAVEIEKLRCYRLGDSVPHGNSTSYVGGNRSGTSEREARRGRKRRVLGLSPKVGTP